MTKLKVKGMTCGHCEAAVCEALKGVPGVKDVVEVSREKELAVVDGDADVSALIAAVKNEGYEAAPGS